MRTFLDTALNSDKPSEFDFSWIPEVNALMDCPQDPIHHPEGNVYNHTLLVLDEAAKVRDCAENPFAFMLAALCHDFGKPAVTEFNEAKGRFTSYNHDAVGALIAEEFVRRIYGDEELCGYVNNLVALHMKPTLYAKNGAREKKWQKLFKSCVSVNDLLLLSACDRRGRRETP